MTVSEEINRVRRWRDGQIKAITKIDSEVYQRILMTACIDAFVQHQACIYNPRKQGKLVHDRDKFSAFLQRYISDPSYSTWLKLVCPTTLYYDYQNYLAGVPLCLQASRIYCADDTDAVSEAERLIMILPEEKRNDARKKHQYSALIYQMRNKLVHEMTYVGCQTNFFADDSNPIPHMVTLSRREDQQLIPYKWALHIPISLLLYCLKESTENYLIECEQQGKNPLGDYDPYQKSTFAFYG